MEINFRKYVLRELGLDNFVKEKELNDDIRLHYATSGHIILTTNTTVFSWNGTDLNKIYSSTVLISSIFGYNDIIYIGFNTGEFISITLTKTIINRGSVNSEKIICFRNINKNLLIFSKTTVYLYDPCQNNTKKIMEEFNNIKDVYINDNMCLILDEDTIKIFDSDYIKLKSITIYSSIRGIRYINDLIIGYDNKRLFIIKDNEIIKEKLVHYRNITDIFIHNGFIYTVADDMHFKSFNFNLDQYSTINIKEKLIGLGMIHNSLYLIGKNHLYSKKCITSIELDDTIKIKKLNEFDEELDVKIFDFNKTTKKTVEKYLSTFNFKKAFNYVFENNNLNEIYCVLKIIQDNRGLKKLLIDQTEEFIISFVEFIIDYFYVNEFQEIFLEAMVILTSIYQYIFIKDEFYDLLILFDNVLVSELQFNELKLQTISFLESF